jgi:hypothetical protein
MPALMLRSAPDGNTSTDYLFLPIRIFGNEQQQSFNTPRTIKIEKNAKRQLDRRKSQKIYGRQNAKIGCGQPQRRREIRRDDCVNVS